MKVEPPTDIRAEAILHGLTELRTLLEEPITRHALDLANNAKTAQQHDILSRTLRSLTQYLRLDGDLFYIGLLGHFSTGKSSTINSLLETWGSTDERATDLNPTDDTISLITRPTNEDFLLGVIREGSVTIRSKSIDNPLLDNIVLVDTPGTGDPALVEEIARDFLPICDIILFFFSAASPLDKDDMPLLTELHRRLPFVPIHFVVTRADELRKDMLAPVSDDNIDPVKRKRFFDDVLSRLNKQLKPTLYTEERFLLIDNRHKFNIAAVSEFIRSNCDPTNPRSRLAMHSHKLGYFATIAKELRSFFETFLDYKLRELNKIVHTAEQNRVRYTENVRISNNNLTKTWLDQLASVHTESERVLKALAEPDVPPATIEGFEPVRKRRQELATEIAEDAQRTARYIGETLKLRLSASIAEQIHQYELISADQLEVNARNGEEPISLKLPALELGSTVSLMPSKLATKWAAFRETKVSSLREAAAKLRKVIEDANALVQTRSPFTECERIVESAQASLTDDLIRFFGSAELYRAGVFTHTTKESIGTLGVGKELDDLESEFDESDRATFTAEATQSLFPLFSETASKARTQLAIIERQLRPQVIRINDLKIPSPETNYSVLDTLIAAESQSTIQDLFRELRDNIGLFLGTLEAKLQSIVGDRRRLYEYELSSARKRRRNLYVGTFVLGGALAAATYWGYTHAVEIPQNNFHAILWNIVSQLIWAPISLLAAKAIDKFPKRSATIKRDHQAALRRDLEGIVDKEIGAYEFAAISATVLAKKLDKAHQNIIDYDPDSWNMAAAERLIILRELHAEFSKARTEWMDLIDTVSTKVSSYFSDATKNLQLLNEVADKIKARAIEPSFKLLGGTRETLHQIRQQVHEVEFG